MERAVGTRKEEGTREHGKREGESSLREKNAPELDEVSEQVCVWESQQRQLFCMPEERSSEGYLMPPSS
jgi:hypothetical protein